MRCFAGNRSVELPMRPEIERFVSSRGPDVCGPQLTPAARHSEQGLQQSGPTDAEGFDRNEPPNPPSYQLTSPG
jgi:hypothetical protein